MRDWFVFPNRKINKNQLFCEYTVFGINFYCIYFGPRHMISVWRQDEKIGVND